MNRLNFLPGNLTLENSGLQFTRLDDIAVTIMASSIVTGRDTNITNAI